MIRQATHDDIDALAKMGQQFLAYSPHGHLVDPSAASMRESIQRIMDHGVVFVGTIGGEIVGCLCATMSNIWFSPDSKVAIELAWWVNEEHRAGTVAVRLVYAYEVWARAQGASVITMSNLIIDGKPSSGTILERLGYIISEQTHIKGGR